jgi:hypothetical protein
MLIGERNLNTKMPIFKKIELFSVEIFAPWQHITGFSPWRMSVIIVHERRINVANELAFAFGGKCSQTKANL